MTIRQRIRASIPSIRRVVEADTTEFEKLFIKVAGLEPAIDFRGADLRNVDFGSVDISNFDLSDADLRGADMSGVRGYERAIKTNARLDGIRRPRSAGILTALSAVP